MKKKPKIKRKTNAQLKKILWKVFSAYTRTRDKMVCFTCGRKAEGYGYHAGHFISKAVGGISLYFNEDNVHGQCYHCNINLGGNSWIFGQKLGEKKVKELYALKNVIIKDFDFLGKIEYYKKKLEELSTP